MCRACRVQVSVTAGTVFEKTRTPLRSWFAAVWYVTNQKQGVSARGLQRTLGLGSYQTAWAMLHRLRRAMVTPGRERLRGVVEVDESYVGDRDVSTKKGRVAQAIRPDSKKSLVAIAVEVPASISHQVTATGADLPGSTALRSGKVLDVLSSTPARFSGRAPSSPGMDSLGRSRTPEPSISAHLHALASRPGEKYALAPKGFGRIRLRRIPDASEESLLRFVCDAIEPGSIVRADGSWAYRSIHQHGYVRDKAATSGAADPTRVSMPAAQRVAARLKRWLLGTHQGSVLPHQLDYYLDEYTFRFNHRSSRSRGLRFYRLLEQAVVTGPVTYEEITANRG